ncbi:MAG: DNA polymerase-3 subunit epsilon [Salibacteraceae bacterium]|jgi:DNA polymerase-3 subunit epsilon
MLFAVVDIETTGGNASTGKITEIAIVITDGESIIEEFDSLVDPGMHIPAFITNLTGITNQMVADAPPFHYIASKVTDLLKDKVFVAHNVNFDYSFIEKELEECGYPMPSKKMCTVRYSRKMVPGKKSYSLGNICSHFGIRIVDAHRAMNDTKATVQLLHELFRLDYKQFWKTYLTNGKEVNLPSGLDLESFSNLPEKPGVYYLKNDKGEILYIGKAVKIRTRVGQHFSGKKTSEKSSGFHKEVCKVDYFLTGSEILALLHEDSEIRKYWPPYNKSQKNPPTKYNLSYYKDQNDNWRVGIIKGKFIGKSLLTAYSLLSARENLFELVKHYELSPSLCQISVPVNQHITDEQHNTHFEELIGSQQENPLNFVIWEAGRKTNEESFILIKEGQFHGFGFIQTGQKTTDYTILKEKLTPAQPSGITAKYVSNYVLTENDVSLSVIEYNDTQLLF